MWNIYSEKEPNEKQMMQFYINHPTNHEIGKQILEV